MESASPWWFVTTTKEASEANVEIVSYKVTNVAGVDPVTSSSKIALAAGADIVTEEVCSTCVHVPVMVNVCALAAGTVLKRYMPSNKEQEDKEPKAMTVAQVAKRARLSG